MQKVFLYLYPIEEYTKVFENDNSLAVLNECIQKRYRKKGYQVIFALYPDKNLYGVIPQPNDRIIYTDITFKEASGYNEDGTKKEAKNIKYPNEQYLINQLGFVDKIVIGGYHAQDCVRRVCECALDCGINSIIDLDMTDFFFHLYKNKDYFKIEEYSPIRYKEHMINKMNMYGDEFAERIFNRNYSSPAYGFNKEENKKMK